MHRSTLFALILSLALSACSPSPQALATQTASVSTAIAGPNVNGWLVQLTGKNYNNIMIVAPIFMVVALGLMLGVKRGEAVMTEAVTGASDL